MTKDVQKAEKKMRKRERQGERGRQNNVILQLQLQININQLCKSNSWQVYCTGLDRFDSYQSSTSADSIFSSFLFFSFSYGIISI